MSSILEEIQFYILEPNGFQISDVQFRADKHPYRAIFHREHPGKIFELTPEYTQDVHVYGIGTIDSLPIIKEEIEKIFEFKLKGPNINQEKPDHQTYKCIIAVDERGDCILLKSTPSLYEFDTFDGSSLNDNVNQKMHLIPTEFGIYKCNINVKCIGYWTDCGTEYDTDIWLDNIEKLKI